MRTEARIRTSRASDTDWTALEFGPQWLYDQLLSQDDLEHHGVIALRPARWAQLAADMTESTVLQFLDKLAEQRFVVIDTAYGEVLVRSLIRGDKIYKQPNVLRSGADRLDQVKSPLIRAALHTELQRIAELHDLTEPCALIIKEMLEATAPGAPRTQPHRTRTAKPSHRPAGNPSPHGPANPSAKGSAAAAVTGMPDPSVTSTPSPSATAAAYRVDMPSGERSANTAAAMALAAEPGVKGSAITYGNPSANPRPKGAAEPPGAPAARPSPRTTQPPQPGADSAESQARHQREASMGQADRDLNDLEAAVQRITAPWAAMLGQAPAEDLYEEVTFRIADALAAGRRPADHVAAALATWQANGGTDLAALDDILDAIPIRQRDRESGGDLDAAARPADDWLTTAKANP